MDEGGVTEGRELDVVRMTELINKALRSLSFLHDPLLVVLPEGAGQLVVVHSWPVLEYTMVNGLFLSEYRL